jgi:RNA polymerase primary sigma factor
MGKFPEFNEQAGDAGAFSEQPASAGDNLEVAIRGAGEEVTEAAAYDPSQPATYNPGALPAAELDSDDTGGEDEFFEDPDEIPNARMVVREAAAGPEPPEAAPRTKEMAQLAIEQSGAAEGQPVQPPDEPAIVSTPAVQQARDDAPAPPHAPVLSPEGQPDHEESSRPLLSTEPEAAPPVELRDVAADPAVEIPDSAGVSVTEAADEEDNVLPETGSEDELLTGEVIPNAVKKIISQMRTGEKLTQERETEIGKAMALARQADTTLKDPALFAEAVRERGVEPGDLITILDREIMEGLDARTELITKSLGEATPAVGKYAYVLSAEDRYSAAYYGIVQAADHFDHEKGYRFSTYASVWTKREILIELYEQGFDFRLPKEMGEQLLSMLTNRSEYLKAYGQEPNEEELADYMGIEVSELQDILFVEERVTEMVSLDDDRQHLEAIDALPVSQYRPRDEGYPEIQALRHVQSQEITSAITKALPLLTDKQREAFQLFSGFGGGLPVSVEQIAEIKGLHQESIRRLLRSTWSRLRTDPALQALFAEFDEL